jgi:hypothetical protein
MFELLLDAGESGLSLVPVLQTGDGPGCPRSRAGRRRDTGWHRFKIHLSAMFELLLDAGAGGLSFVPDLQTADGPGGYRSRAGGRPDRSRPRAGGFAGPEGWGRLGPRGASGLSKVWDDGGSSARGAVLHGGLHVVWNHDDKGTVREQWTRSLINNSM